MKLSRQQKERLYYAVMESLKPLVIKHLNEDIYRHIDFTPDNDDEFYTHNNSTLYMTNGTDFDPLLGPGEEENEPYFKYMKNKAPKKYKSPNWNVSQQAIDRFLYGDTKSHLEKLIDKFVSVEHNPKVAKSIMNNEGTVYLFFDIKKPNVYNLVDKLISRGYKEKTYKLKTPNSTYIIVSETIYNIIFPNGEIKPSFPSNKELQVTLGQFAGHTKAEMNDPKILSDIVHLFWFTFRIPPQKELSATIEFNNGNITDELPWIEFKKECETINGDDIQKFNIIVPINPNIQREKAQMFYNNPNSFINKEYKNTVTVERERNSWIITTPTLEDLYNAFH